MDLGITGRVAVVTGAGRGIGEAVAALLREEGATVLDASRATGIDVTAADAADRIAAAAGAPVDILVNNAGTSFVKPLAELSDEDWQAQWDLHVTAPRRLMQAFAPGMAERKWGRIVNVTSSSGKRPSLTNAAYSVSKAAQLSLSRVFAEAYAGTGVLVNAVAPGAVSGPLWLAPGGLAEQVAASTGKRPEEVVEAQAAKIPLGRLIEPGEIAAVIAFLCSERAGAVLGAAWSADGGSVPSIV
jgi:3-oxoacyl-[acyl-carrier protein] reductase